MAARKPATPKPANKAPHACRCGCKAMITTAGAYRPGHDARHVKNLRESFEAGKQTRAQVLATAEKAGFSPALTRKLVRALDLAAERVAARKAVAKPRPATGKTLRAKLDDVTAKRVEHAQKPADAAKPAADPQPEPAKEATA